MKTKYRLIGVSFACATLAGCAFSLLSHQSKNEMPNAIGKLEIVFSDGKRSSCVGSLIEKNKILSLKHCVSGGSVSSITFHPSGKGKSISVMPPAGVGQSIDKLADFPDDVAFFSTIGSDFDIQPIPVLHGHSTGKVIQLDYATLSNNDIKITKCEFKEKSYLPGSYASEECYTPEGTSGRPFLKWDNGEWKISGIYHGYLKIKNSNGEPLTLGVATTPSQWTSY